MQPESYHTRDHARKDSVTAPLHRQQWRTKGNLDAWVTRGLAGMKPWQWDLRARLDRAWHRNPNHTAGAHSKERGEREAELQRDLQEHARIRGGMAAHRLPGAAGIRAKAILHQLERLLADPAWYTPRRLVDRATGETRETLYLPEDTWSAQTALHWCIQMLRRLVQAAWGMTEKVTPRSTSELAVKHAIAIRAPDDAPAHREMAQLLARLNAKWGESEAPAT